MGDAHLSSQEALHNFFPAALYTNWLRTIADSEVNGTFPDVVPIMHYYQAQPGDPAWTAAFPLVTTYVVQHYGDLRLAQQNYDAISVSDSALDTLPIHILQAFIEWLISLNAQYGIHDFWGQFGDWVWRSVVL